MALLTGIIPTQNFEVVRDRIAEILADEINNQITLRGAETPALDVSHLPTTVAIERIIPFDKTELPGVDVSFSNGDYGNKDQTQVDGNYDYFIDCYASAKTSDDPDNAGELLRADYAAKVKLHKLLGVCRAILENPKYRTLGYTPPFCATVGVKTIAIADPERQDAVTTVMGRLVFTLRVPETVELVEPRAIDGYSTTVILYETDKGYHYGPPTASTLESETGDSLVSEDGSEALITE